MKDIERKDLTAVVGDDAENAQILGHTTWSTIGNDVIVPRSWLKERMEQLGIASYLPRATTHCSAFSRTRKHLFDDGQRKEHLHGHRIVLETAKDKNSRTSVLLREFIPAEDDDEDGEWEHTTLGRFHREDNGMSTRPAVSKDSKYWSKWVEIAEEGRELYKKLLQSHTGYDLQRAYREFLQTDSSSVRLRPAGSVYFVPIHKEDKFKGFKTLLSEIDEKFKDKGYHSGIESCEVIDSEEKEIMVQEKVERQVSNHLEDALDEAFGELEEEEDDIVDEVVEGVEEAVESQEELVAEYNALLDVKMDVRELLKQKFDDLGHKKKRIAKEVV